MISDGDFRVFEKWLDAPAYAFGRAGKQGVVPPEDKESYWRIYSGLRDAAERAQLSHSDAEKLILRPKMYSRERGSRGHRPTDLWVSICAKGADAFGYMPQVYAIASTSGLEIGFAASISEDDYFDADVKERNRTLIPFINSKLPRAEEKLVGEIDNTLRKQGRWAFNRKTRLSPTNEGYDQFASLSELLLFLKEQGDKTGAGTICRLFPPDSISDVDVGAEFELALSNFGPLLARCAPTPWDMEVRQAQDFVQAIAVHSSEESVDEEEGKERIWTEIAKRQGQAIFRKDLFDAYDGKCAMTRTDVPDVLQAAHIRPYNGPKTNHVTNGLLLRADVHNLFDLKLLTIEPNSLTIQVSSRLRETGYWKLNGRKLGQTRKSVQKPDRQALEEHFGSLLKS
ncbi:MAG: HNH endonuclease signature motif containing protein [Roseibium sp.]